MARSEAARSFWIAGSATLTPAPSTKDMLDPRIVATRIQRFDRSAQSPARGVATITPSSHGAVRRLIIAVPSRRKTRSRSGAMAEAKPPSSAGGAVGAEAFLLTEHGQRQLEALLPEQRFHRDV